MTGLLSWTVFLEPNNPRYYYYGQYFLTTIIHRTIIMDGTFIILAQKYWTGLLLWTVLLLIFQENCPRYFYLRRVFYLRPESICVVFSLVLIVLTCILVLSWLGASTWNSNFKTLHTKMKSSYVIKKELLTTMQITVGFHKIWSMATYQLVYYYIMQKTKW